MKQREKMRNTQIMRRETQEAILAGEDALESLIAAQERLSSAKSWGVFDMLGGGVIASMVKHSKMNEAAELMEEAKERLQRFQRELFDVDVPQEFQMEISGFLSFADFFFDGIVADYLVQSKINDAREQVDDAIERVRKILGDLKKW